MWKRSCILALVLVLAAAQDEESRLIAVLQSDQGPAAKDRACFELRQWGTAKAVPALAGLLADESLSVSARCALEAMPCPEAGAALREAFPKTAGTIRAGIIDSLGVRRDRQAVPALAALAADPDPLTASAAAAALGKIGGPDAVRALRGMRSKFPDALLRCADLALAGGDVEAARSIYQEMTASTEREHVRTAGHLGMFRAAGEGAIPLVESALTGKDRAAQRAALPWVREMKGEAATKAFADLVSRVSPELQVALLESLEQRGDPAAVPAVAAAVGSPVPEVRIAALQALGILGDASIAPLLAETAAKASGAEQNVARRSLDLLRDAKVRDVLLAHLPKAPPAVQGEIVRALGQRQEAQAVPALLKMAEEGEESIRMVALRSLAVLADGRAVDVLIRLLLRAKTDAEREAVERALAAAGERGDQREAGGRVLESMKGAEVPARAALLRVAGRLGGAESLTALRTGLQDGEAAIQDAAIRTMAEFAGLDAAPDLIKLAREEPSMAHRVLALRGYWRLVGLAVDRPPDQRWAMCKEAMAAAKRPEEKKLGLTELARVAHPEALQLAETLCGEEAVRGEAEAAVVRIASALAGSHPAAKAALRRISTESKNEALRAEAAQALGAGDANAGYITGWQAAGPYRQEGKPCQELYDIPFPPEQPGGKGVAWKPAPRPADPALSWQADLGSVVGGDHAVAYLKARVRSPKETKVRLEIGTDDGVKVWVNGKLVHANNAIRGLKPGEDRAEAVLKEGANEFLLKITQHTLGCGACVRLRGLDGSVIEGLQFE
jgi:HEAT repeat protein